MTNNLIIPVLLQILGAAVIIAEFIVPSMGVLTITALALIGYSLYMVFTTISPSVGFIFIILDIMLLPILVIVGIKLLAISPVTLRTTLKNKENNKEDDSENRENLAGKKGKTVTDLYPSGIALINGTKVDVVSRGDYIEKGTEIKVMSIEGNKVTVDKIFNN